jgi:hypothetical protein
MRPYLKANKQTTTTKKKSNIKKGGIGPEFKPRYCKKKKEKVL